MELMGETGAQGPQGLDGPRGGTALVVVYDAENRKIG